MISGICRGQKIHLACATEEEAMVAWTAFWREGDPRVKGKCERCDKPLNEVPEP